VGVAEKLGAWAGPWRQRAAASVFDRVGWCWLVVQVIKEKELYRADLDKAKSQIKEADAAISSQKAEIDKLNHIINEADQERIRQKKEYDIVVNERDILGTQLVRRNDELALLYEKIKIQQSTLSKGQIQYRDRLNEIRVLKVRCALARGRPCPWRPRPFELTRSRRVLPSSQCLLRMHLKEGGPQCLSSLVLD
jgi:hypothetical protein